MRSDIQEACEACRPDDIGSAPTTVYARVFNWKENGDLYAARVLESDYKDANFLFDALNGTLVPVEQYRLKYDPSWNWTIFSSPLRDNHFLKGDPFVLSWDDKENLDDVGALVLPSVPSGITANQSPP